MTVAFLPLPGTCISIIVSVLALPPSSCVPSAAQFGLGRAVAAVVAEQQDVLIRAVDVLGLATIADPSRSPAASILAPTAMLLVKFDPGAPDPVARDDDGQREQRGDDLGAEQRAAGDVAPDRPRPPAGALRRVWRCAGVRGPPAAGVELGRQRLVRGLVSGRRGVAGQTR